MHTHSQARTGIAQMQLAAMQLNHRQYEAQPQPASRRAATLVQPIEATEDEFAFRLRFGPR
jgi:hypothetical protein